MNRIEAEARAIDTFSSQKVSTNENDFTNLSQEEMVKDTNIGTSLTNLSEGQKQSQKCVGEDKTSEVLVHCADAKHFDNRHEDLNETKSSTALDQESCVDKVQPDHIITHDQVEVEPDPEEKANDINENEIKSENEHEHGVGDNAIVIGENEEKQHHGCFKNPIVKGITFFCGLICLGLGGLGVVLPGLPTTPFILLAAFCFDRSSQRFHNFLLNNRIFGPLIRDWRKHRALPSQRTKISALCIVVLCFAVSITIFALNGVTIAVIALSILCCILLFFLGRLPVMTNDQRNDSSREEIQMEENGDGDGDGGGDGEQVAETPVE